MKLINCPLNGPRNVSEFVFGGEVRSMPGADCSDREWADFVFYPDNSDGVVREWWLHQASGYWFIAERDRTTDEIVHTFDPGELFTEPVWFDAPEGEP